MNIYFHYFRCHFVTCATRKPAEFSREKIHMSRLAGQIIVEALALTPLQIHIRVASILCAFHPCCEFQTVLCDKHVLHDFNVNICNPSEEIDRNRIITQQQTSRALESLAPYIRPRTLKLKTVLF